MAWLPVLTPVHSRSEIECFREELRRRSFRRVRAGALTPRSIVSRLVSNRFPLDLGARAPAPPLSRHPLFGACRPPLPGSPEPSRPFAPPIGETSRFEVRVGCSRSRVSSTRAGACGSSTETGYSSALRRSLERLLRRRSRFTDRSRPLGSASSRLGPSDDFRRRSNPGVRRPARFGSDGRRSSRIGFRGRKPTLGASDTSFSGKLHLAFRRTSSLR